jgi:hypothetical protein
MEIGLQHTGHTVINKDAWHAGQPAIEPFPRYDNFLADMPGILSKACTIP